jgi:menaquinone-dependent protoporphyrinogen IX oxidase
MTIELGDYMKNVLVTYYSKTNTTKMIAEKIGELISSESLKVSIQPIEATTRLSDYDGVIIGAPIHGMRWATEIVDYINLHASELKDIKTAYFFSSYIIKTGSGFWRRAITKSLDTVNELISPIQQGKFGGRVDKVFGGFPRLIFGIKKSSPIDVVDWEEVAAFADLLKVEL